MSLRRRRLIAVGPAAWVAGWGALAGATVRASTLERPRLTLAVAGSERLVHLPLAIAARLGFFDAEGLRLQIVDYAAGPHAWRALATGDADVAAGDFEYVLRSNAKGHALRAVALMGRTPQLVLGVHPKAVPRFESMADLKGRRIGVAAPGSASHRMVELALVQAGLQPTDVRIVGVGAGSGAVAAMRARQIDAIAGVDPAISQLRRSIGLAIVVDTRDTEQSERLYGGPMTSACVAVSQAFIDRHPATTQALVNAIVRADKWIHATDADEIVGRMPGAQVARRRGVYTEALRASKGALSPDGLFNERGAETALRALQRGDASMAQAVVELGAAYTNDFALAANARYPGG